MKISFACNNFNKGSCHKTPPKTQFSVAFGLNFNGYKSSKYMEKSYTKNSLLNPDTAPDNLPPDIDIQDEGKTLKYGEKRLLPIYKHFGLSSDDVKIRETAKNQLNITLNRLSGSGLDASNLDMLTRLVEDKKLTLSVLGPLNKDYRVSREVSGDLDILYGAYAEKKDVKSAFVPEFKSEDEALLALKTGEVCEIRGENNISIKTKENCIKRLFITRDTYLELFPPVERFITAQKDVGDCYLLSAINSINNNPACRHKILEMFRENPDNTVDIVFGGFEKRGGKVLPKNPENDILCDIASIIPKHRLNKGVSSACEGIRAIEALSEFERQNLIRRFIIKKYNELKGQGENAPFASSSPYTEEEIKYYIKYVDTKGPDEMFCLQDITSAKQFTLQRDEIAKRLEELNGKKDDKSRYEALILQRWLNQMDKTGAPAYDIFGEDIPREFVLNLFKNVTEADLYYNNAGCVSDIFKKFGLEIVRNAEYVFCAERELFDSAPNNYVFAVSTQKGAEEMSDKKFISNHAYSLECIDIKGERRFLIKDPHNSSEEIMLTYDKLKKYFSRITVAKI